MGCWPEIDTSLLTPHQAEQVRIALSGPVAILTGGPGVGKTFCAAQIIKSCEMAFGEGSVAIVAPTGRAAVNMTVALQKHGFSGCGQTIHSLLGPSRNGHDGGGWSFIHNEHNPLLFKVMVIDEFSMCDTKLAASLFSACPTGSLILILGDTCQLPPVGPGAPLRDMIAAGIPTARLNEVHRFAGRIAQVCKAINDGKPWQPSEQVDLEPVNGFPENLRHIERFNPAQQIEALKTVIDRVVNKRGFDAIWDMQVLCAVNDKSPVCRTKLNEVLQELLNPNGERLERNPFRVGDKVMVLRNGFRTEHWFEEKPSIAMEHYLANGEIGRVDHISEHWIAAWFGGCGQMIRFDRNEWTDVTLAYACTVHKAQGAGFPVVIVMIDGSGGAGFVCSRSHHYTAISRSAKLCVTIGRKSVMADHCKRVDTERRKTFLTEEIKSWLV